MESNTCSAPNGSYVPPKDWTALSDSEKIERMRDIIKNIQSNLSYANSANSKLKKLLVNHEHTSEGVIIKKKVQEYYDELQLSCSTGIGQQNKYF